jgi:hypothetical protein
LRDSAIGFTVKSGWAIAVLLTGPRTDPRVVDSRHIDLSDPALPESRQPYHAGFGTARARGRVLTKLVASVERFGQRAVTELIREYQDGGHRLRAAGVVVGSLIDPEHIANDHIRIHALEGRLFREVVEAGAARNGLRSAVWRERDLQAAASDVLGRSESAVRGALTELGRAVNGSWRGEHKNAALAAWLVLARPPRLKEARRLKGHA